MTASEIADIVRGFAYAYRNEADVQAAVVELLSSKGHAVMSEVPLTDRDRIDLVVDRVGVEIKIKGSAANVARQLQRYAESDLIDELVLVTGISRHEAFLGATIGGKPVTVVWIGGTL